MSDTQSDMIELPDEGDFVRFTFSRGVIREGFIEQYNFGSSGYPTSFTLKDNPDARYPIYYLVEKMLKFEEG